MRTFVLAAVAAGLALFMAPSTGASQVRAGVVLDSDGLRSFHVAISHHYGIPERTVRRHAALRIHPEELPVVYLLAHEARVSPETVIALRSRGWSWMEVTHHLRVSPRVFVAGLSRGGPPYGKAHGYWRQPRGRELRHLSDRQIIDYANLQFRTAYHREPVDRVLVVRERHPSWVAVQMKEPPGRGVPGRGGPGRAQAPPIRRN